jgi:hypothetical protein
MTVVNPYEKLSQKEGKSIKLITSILPTTRLVPDTVVSKTNNYARTPSPDGNNNKDDSPAIVTNSSLYPSSTKYAKASPQSSLVSETKSTKRKLIYDNTDTVLTKKNR